MAATKKKYWSTVPKPKLKKQMKKLSDARWDGISQKKRSEHARMMALARWGKIRSGGR